MVRLRSNTAHFRNGIAKIPTERKSIGDDGKVRSLHVMPIIKLDGRLVDHTFKNIKRRAFTTDDILIFPRTRTELIAEYRRAVDTCRRSNCTRDVQSEL
jgi:hypothetical protein